MGSFSCPLHLTSLDGERSLDVDATVDAGSDFTTLPSGVLTGMGVEPTGSRGFRLADGRQVELQYGHAWATINRESVITLVVFGDENSPPLLGAYTLEGLALAVDPLAQRLVPRQMIMY